MVQLGAWAVSGLQYVYSVQVGAGRGAAIAVTAALIVLAFGQMRPMESERPPA